jgi:hypothetical protein
MPLMSRSDFWSIAATLIVAGAGYFIGGQKAAYGSIGIGVLIALYLLATHKKSEPAAANTANAQSTASPQITTNPQITANPVVSQHTHLHLSGHDQPEKHPVPAPKPRPHHNLRLHSCKMMKIEPSYGEGGDADEFHATDDQTKPNAAVVCIRNKSKDSEVAYLDNVRAALVFRDSDAHEIGSGIHQAVWLNNHLCNPSFDLEETKCVILAFMVLDAKGRVTEVGAPFVRTKHDEFGGVIPTLEEYSLGDNLRTVELILLSENSRVMEPLIFEFFDDNDKPGIRLVSGG